MNKHTNACARSPRWAGRGEARQKARAHDMCVNGLSKSSSNRSKLVTSFCRLFLLRVRIRGRCNPSQVTHINMCGRHGTCNYELRTPSHE
jgi:hypothetical protein